MEIFGSTFDDSVFLEARDRVSVALTTYNVKLCEPQVKVYSVQTTLVKMTITATYAGKLLIKLVIN